MSQLIEVKVDVSKISKEKLYEGKKGKYLTLIVSVNDEVDDYGNDVSAYEAQSDAEKTAKANKNFLGNGKTFWAQGSKIAKDKPVRGGGTQETKAPAGPPSFDDDDLPF